MQNDAADVIPLSEAAAILEMSVQTLHRRVASGDIVPVRKLPGLRGPYLFDRSYIERIKKERAA